MVNKDEYIVATAPQAAQLVRHAIDYLQCNVIGKFSSPMHCCLTRWVTEIQVRSSFYQSQHHWPRIWQARCQTHRRLYQTNRNNWHIRLFLVIQLSYYWHLNNHKRRSAASLLWRCHSHAGFLTPQNRSFGKDCPKIYHSWLQGRDKIQFEIR